MLLAGSSTRLGELGGVARGMEDGGRGGVESAATAAVDTLLHTVENVRPGLL